MHFVVVGHRGAYSCPLKSHAKNYSLDTITSINYRCQAPMSATKRIHKRMRTGLRMTHSDLAKTARFVKDSLRDDEIDAEAAFRISQLIVEVMKLGGPVCVGCGRNSARYTTDLCGLCDMQLPPGQRGVRL